jgi:hypothetical protein
MDPCAAWIFVLCAVACNGSAPPPEAPIVVAVTDAGPAPIASTPEPTPQPPPDEPVAEAAAPDPFVQPGAPVPTMTAGTAFDRGAAARGLSGVNVQQCKRAGGPVGSGHVKVTFDPSGVVSAVIVDSGPYPGTPVGTCVAAAFRRVRVPGFTGAPVNVGKSFTIN